MSKIQTGREPLELAAPPDDRTTEDQARLRLASMAPSSQMLCLRVSGITKMAMRNMMAGTAMG